nr:hypothetical protein [Tanacetum cinerariifolium]
MAQHVIPVAQLVPKYHSIRRCNNYVVLQSIPCSPECKIAGQLLLDHLLSYSLTGTADVHAVYLQQFWRTVNKDYHSIKDDIRLVSVYTTGDVRVRGMLISDEFLTEKIRATNDFKEYETVVERDHDDDDSKDRLEPENQKDNPEHVDDDDKRDDEKVDEEEGGGIDKNITQELTNTVPLLLQPHQTSHSKREISSKYSHLPEDLIESNLKPCIATTIIEDLDAFRFEVQDLVSQEYNAQAPNINEELFKNHIQSNVIQVYPTTTTSTKTTSSADLQHQLYVTMKSKSQDQAADLEIWEILKAKFEK